jgi:hypothetical protein
MTTEQELERTREMQRIANAYKRVFATEDGQTVLNNLKAYFEFGRPCFKRPMPGLAYDPIAAALRDGNHEPIMLIESKLRMPFIADGDITSPKTSVKV